MKNLKKFASVLLALTLLFAMATSVFAEAGKTTITINDNGVRSSYEAYRLLNVTNSGEKNEKWAYTLNDTYTEILKEVTGVAEDEDIIPAIEDMTGDDDAIRQFADEVYAAIKEMNADETASDGVFEGVDQGYYLIIETAKKDNNDTISLVMLNTAGNEEITVDTKESTPTLKKEVQDTDDSVANSTTDWQDSADYDIGDTIPYKLTGTLSSEYANYESYYYSFEDKMEKLTFADDDTFEVVVSNNGDEEDVTDEFAKVWDAEKKLLTVTCVDLKKIEDVTIDKDSKIIVYYTAILDTDAIIGSAGNPNEAKLIYNNNPYYEGAGKPETPGETPVDTNIVFTYEGIVNKVDKSGNALDGAGFTLKKFDATKNEYVNVGKEIKDVTTFEFKGLDAGMYKLVETTIPDGYNKADDIEFVIEATHETESPNPKLETLVVKNSNGEVISEGVNSVFTANKTAGSVTTDVVNEAGAKLPSTGGMGTTVFYVLGGILVFGAGVLLITKKRMSKNN